MIHPTPKENKCVTVAEKKTAQILKLAKLCRISITTYIKNIGDSLAIIELYSLLLETNCRPAYVSAFY